MKRLISQTGGSPSTAALLDLPSAVPVLDSAGVPPSLQLLNGESAEPALLVSTSEDRNPCKNVTELPVSNT